MIEAVLKAIWNMVGIDIVRPIQCLTNCLESSGKWEYLKDLTWSGRSANSRPPVSSY